MLNGIRYNSVPFAFQSSSSKIVVYIPWISISMWKQRLPLFPMMREDFIETQPDVKKRDPRNDKLYIIVSLDR